MFNALNPIGKILKITIIVSALIGLAACGEVIDGSSPQNFNSSTEKIMRGMSAEKMQEFKSDLRKASSYIAHDMGKNNQGENFVAAMMNTGAYNAKIIERLHGKSVSDIQGLAKEWDAVVREQQEKEKEAGKNRRIAELKKAIDIMYDSILAYEKLRNAFGKISIENVKLSLGGLENWHISQRPLVVSGAVVNNSDLPIVGVDFYVPGIFLEDYPGVGLVAALFRNDPIQPKGRRDFKITQSNAEWFLGKLKNPKETNAYLASSKFPLKSIEGSIETQKDHQIVSVKYYDSQDEHETAKRDEAEARKYVAELNMLEKGYKSQIELAYRDFVSGNNKK